MVLSATHLLAVWEDGLTQHPLLRALALLTAAWPELSAEDLLQMSIGQRDACLLQLRELLFGQRLSAMATCPQCHERLELAFSVSDIQSGRVSLDDHTIGRAGANPTFDLAIADHQVRFRLPNNGDILTTLGAKGDKTVRRMLLRRCVQLVEKDGEDVTESAFDALPGVLEQAVAEQMAEVDPQGHVQLALCCPGCAYQWLQTFDIVTYLWSEINDWAQRTLREVHLLASAYGWREQDILAMSSRRRRLYLEIMQG